MKMTTVFLDSEVFEKITTSAKRMGLSRGAFIRYLIHQYLKKEGVL